MEKKKWVKFAGFAMLVLLSLFLCVGCADNGVEDSDEVTFIDFSRESASSRGIESWNENLYPPESLYWTYKATKIRGNYTTGQTQTEQAVVKNGPAPGLGTVGPFSVGVWKFEVFGYTKCMEDSSTGELVFTCVDDPTATDTYKKPLYKGEKQVTIDKRTDSSQKLEVVFELNKGEAYSTIMNVGKLNIEDMTLTVPEGQRFTVDSAATPVTTYVRVTVTDVTNTTARKVVAVSKTEISGKKESGTKIPLNAFDFADYEYADHIFGVNNDGSAKMYQLEFKAEYLDVFTDGEKDAGEAYASTAGWAQIGEIKTYPISIMGGVTTTLSGDINDIQVATDTNKHDVKYDWAVAKITWKDVASNPDGTGVDYSIYTSLKEAVTAYLANPTDVNTEKKYVELIHDLDIAETVTVSADVPVYMNKHFAENITISGAGSLTFKMATDNTRNYKVSGDGFVVNNIKPEKTTGSDKVWLTTTGTGTVEVNASTDTVWHTGTAGTVKVVACKYANTDRTKGYHLGTDKDGAATVTKVSTVELTAGNLEIGGCTTVETLTVKGASAKVWGKKNSVVNVYKYDATALNTKGGAATALATSNANAKAVFEEIVLCDNKTSPVKKYVYGIEGMYCEIPMNAFVWGSIVLGRWNTKSDKSGTYYGGMYDDVYVAGTAADADGVNLYAVWNALPVGGTIYSIDSDNGASYKFYKADGTALTTLSTAGLVDAEYYYVTGKRTDKPDRFWVYADVTMWPSTPCAFSKRNNASSENYYNTYQLNGRELGVEVYDSVVYTPDPTFGYVPLSEMSGYLKTRLYGGKVQTDYFLNIGTLGRTDAGWSDDDLNGSGTMMAALKSFRADSANNGGCTDWFVPSISEALVLKDAVGDDFYDNFGLYTCSMGWWQGYADCTLFVDKGYIKGTPFLRWSSTGVQQFCPIRSF